MSLRLDGESLPSVEPLSPGSSVAPLIRRPQGPVVRNVIPSGVRRAPTAAKSAVAPSTASATSAIGSSTATDAAPADAAQVAVASLFDPEALEAVISGGSAAYASSGQREWDEDPVLVAQRVALRVHGAVIDAACRCAAALQWERATQDWVASGEGESKDVDESPSVDGGDSMLSLHFASPRRRDEVELTKAEYLHFHRACCEMLRPDLFQRPADLGADASVTAAAEDDGGVIADREARWRSIAELDWQRDLRRAVAPTASEALARYETLLADASHSTTSGDDAPPRLSFVRFFEALFELADRWTTTCRAGDYVQFLSLLAEGLAAKRELSESV